MRGSHVAQPSQSRPTPSDNCRSGTAGPPGAGHPGARAYPRVQRCGAPSSVQPVLTAPPVTYTRQASPFTPRDGPVQYTPRDGMQSWAHPVHPPIRSMSVPRVRLAPAPSMAALPVDEGGNYLHAAPIAGHSGGACGSATPAPGAPLLPMAQRVRHIPARPGQFIRLSQEDSSCHSSRLETSSLSRLQQALADQRADHEARLAQLQAQWDERFTEAVAFWHKAWSTTTAVVKDCNTHCVKLSQVLEASLDQLGQSSLELSNLQSRVLDLEAAAGLSSRPAAGKNAEDGADPEAGSRLRQEGLRCLSGTSDSFKRLSHELAQFEQEVSDQSQKLLGTHLTFQTKFGAEEADCANSTVAELEQSSRGEAEDKPSTAAGALPRTELGEAHSEELDCPAGFLASLNSGWR
ncbi:unnamed protein product [Effrenium voratum]|uniref:Uncharacterized protein n=1 Tax=Effrenium voratum TaxID=2562239 RepID=A0AA36NGY8_9DINO|nr:unnamed protein product [Effrenium voratum]CAJ1448203.1 unnamed protein product [Effrenium voratum]|mmetsp:Transcript_51110/g.122381  ORF Transcript_51110/g.122381 Transcript_51110/m.122381 type:complete len:406 (-) Transcript_51110:64-1281(-)